MVNFLKIRFANIVESNTAKQKPKLLIEIGTFFYYIKEYSCFESKCIWSLFMLLTYIACV